MRPYSSLDLISARYIFMKACCSAPQAFEDIVRIRLKIRVQSTFSCTMCDLNANLLLKVTSKNFFSFTCDIAFYGEIWELDIALLACL